MEIQKIILGQCPRCGGNVVKTSKGFRCENACLETPTCAFTISPLLCNRPLSDTEVAQLLAGESVIIDGMSSNEGKIFTSIATLDRESMEVKISQQASVCPKCGATLYVGSRAFNCANQSNSESPCDFVIWRTFGGHMLTSREVKEICEQGITKEQLTLLRQDGVAYGKRLALSADKSKIVCV